jgi:hypothetical protein
LGANVVVELHSESHARRATSRAWAIIRRGTALTGWPVSAPVVPTVATPTAPPEPTQQPPRQLEERGMVADVR